MGEELDGWINDGIHKNRWEVIPGASNRDLPGTMESGRSELHYQDSRASKKGKHLVTDYYSVGRERKSESCTCTLEDQQRRLPNAPAQSEPKSASKSTGAVHITATLLY